MSDAAIVAETAMLPSRRARWRSGRVREALGTALPPWRTLAPTVLYCLRTMTAIAIALYAAFALQLESPLSSVITVLIVANPVTGALISKSVWRLLGTVIGASVAVLLMAGFGQSPILFGVVFSLCIGVACIASTLLRFFKAYGAVLAGYTIIIVSGPAFSDPENVFIGALARLSAVSVGIAAAALVFLLTNVRPPSRLGNVTVALIRNTGAVMARHAVAQPADSPVPDNVAAGFYDQRGALLAEVGGLTEIIEYAAADSYAVSRRADRLRLGAAGLMGTLTALNPFYGRVGLHPALADEVRPAFEALAALPLEAPGPVLDQIARTRDRVAAGFELPPPGLSSGSLRDSLDYLGTLEHAYDMLDRLHRAVSRLTLLPDAAQSGAPAVRLRLFLDWPTALRNGARGSIVTMLAFLFWYITQWPAGPTLLSYLVPAACLLATNPSASRASVDFSIGTLLAIPASFFCESLLLPQITGFPLLLGALAICLLPGIWFQFHPRHNLRAFGYVVFFNAMITVNNPIRFDDIALFNNWLAFVMGTAALVVVFRALLPANPRRDANRLIHSITRAVARLGTASGLGAATRLGPLTSSLAAPGSRKYIASVEIWESLQMQKASRLIQRLQPLEVRLRQRTIDCAFVTIELGRDLLRLRRLLAETALEPPQRAAGLDVLKASCRLRHDPHQVAILARAAIDCLMPDPAETPAAPLAGRRRLAALLHEIATLIEAVPDFLRHDFLLADRTAALC